MKNKKNTTFTMIKPDAVKRNLIGKVITEIESRGFHIIAQKMIHLTKEMAEEFYSEHQGKGFFSDMIRFITDSPVVAMVLEHEEDNIIDHFREAIGDTNPENASEGTIRKKFGLSIDQNSIHGSDSKESAKREMEFFFNHDEIY